MADRLSSLTVLFAVCSVFGWVYETVDNAIQFGGLWLRAALVLPWCPIYGIGALVLLAVMRPLADRLESAQVSKVATVAILLAVAYVLSFLIELVGSYVCEVCFGAVPWDYSAAPLNFDGRVAPMYTIRFALFAMLALYVVEPWVREVSNRHPQGIRAAALTVAVLMVADTVGEWLGAWDALENGLANHGIRHW